MKSKKEIDDLKKDWLNDPCWDIEVTAGFEDHKDELKAFRLEKEAEWTQQREQRIKKRCDELGCTKKMVLVIESLECRIAELESTHGLFFGVDSNQGKNILIDLKTLSAQHGQTVHIPGRSRAGGK